jgi:hypothetical protein
VENTDSTKSLQDLLEELAGKQLKVILLEGQTQKLKGKLALLEKDIESAQNEGRDLSEEIAWRAKMTGAQIDKSYKISNPFVPYHIVSQVRSIVVARVPLGKDFDFSVIAEEAFIRQILERIHYVVESRGLMRDRKQNIGNTYSYRKFSEEEIEVLANEVISELARCAATSIVA